MNIESSTIEKIAEQLGVTAAELWPLLIDYQMWSSIATICAVISVIVLVRIADKSISKVEFTDDENKFVARMLTALISLPIFGAACGCVYGSIAGIINPEAALVWDVINKAIK